MNTSVLRHEELVCRKQRAGNGLNLGRFTELIEQRKHISFSMRLMQAKDAEIEGNLKTCKPGNINGAKMVSDRIMREVLNELSSDPPIDNHKILQLCPNIQLK